MAQVNGRPLKVTVFTTSPKHQAFYRLGLDLVAGLSLHNVDAELLLLNTEGQDSQAANAIKVRSLNVSKSQLSVLPLLKHLASQRPDILLSFPHLVNIPAVLANSMDGRRTKHFVGEHGVFSLDRSIEWKYNLRYRLLEFLIPNFYPWADGIIACAPDVLSDLKEKCHFSLPKFQTSILNPINPDRIIGLSKVPVDSILRAPDKNILKITTLARLAHQKHLHTIVEAAAILKRQNVAFQISIMGEGPLRNQLAKMICDKNVKDEVLLIGNVSNPYPAIASSDVFVLSSAWEGCPISMMEAMSLGVPCIGTDAPGAMRELLANDSGVIVKLGDATGLAEALMKLNAAPNDRKAIGDAGKIRVSELCRYDYIAKLYLNAFTKIKFAEES